MTSITFKIKSKLLDGFLGLSCSPYSPCFSMLTSFLLLKITKVNSPQGLCTGLSLLSGRRFIQTFAELAFSCLSDLSSSVKLFSETLPDYLLWSNPSVPLYHVIILFSTWSILFLTILFLVNWKYLLNSSLLLWRLAQVKWQSLFSNSLHSSGARHP